MLGRLMSSESEPYAEQAPTYDDSLKTFRAAAAAWTAVNDSLAALEILESWNRAGKPERNSDRLEWMRGQIARHWPEEKPRPFEHRIPAMILAAREAVALAYPAWHAANIEFEIAKSKETSRIAKGLQTKQRRAVRAIAAAAEKLSEAMAAERELHHELARTAPNSTSVYLPGCSPRFGGFEDYRSELSAWRGRMRQLKLLD